jgi:hypothetical protein
MAALTTLLFKALVAPAAKVLLKRWLQDPALEFGNGIIDYLSDSTAAALSPREQIKIRRALEDLATGVVDRVEPLLAAETAEHLNVEAVVQAMGTTFDDATLATAMVQANLQPDAVFRVLEQRQPHAPVGWVETLLREQRALVLWDGADEIPPNFRRAMLRAMRGMMASYPGNFFVLSTRPGIRIQWADDLGLSKADIAPMARPDIAQFVTHWHRAVAMVRNTAYPSRASQLPAQGEALIQQLDNEPAVLRLATNPLLCSAICSLHYQEKGYLPDKQHRLCEKLCEMLLHERDRKRLHAESSPEPYTRLDYEQKKRLVQHLAYEMVQSGRSAITWGEARRLVAQQLPRFDGAAAADGDAVTQTLLERSGLLGAYQAEAIEFVHNTLKEYLAAEEFCTGLVDRLVQGALGPAGRDEALTWHNVVVFAAALGSEQFATDLIHQVLAVPLDAPSRERQRQILALRRMAAATRLPEELRSPQRTLERTLFPPRNLTEATYLATAGEQVIRFLRPQPRFKTRHLAACVRTLRLIGTEAAHAALRDYLGFRQKDILDELVQAVHPLEIPVVVEWVQQRGRLPDGYRPYIQDVQPLLGKSGLQVLDLGGTSVSDVGPLAQLTSLQTLWLTRMRVSDVGPLAQLTSLQRLWLDGTRVSDVGPLAQLRGLQIVDP